MRQRRGQTATTKRWPPPTQSPGTSAETHRPARDVDGEARRGGTRVITAAIWPELHTHALAHAAAPCRGLTLDIGREFDMEPGHDPWTVRRSRARGQLRRTQYHRKAEGRGHFSPLKAYLSARAAVQGLPQQARTSASPVRHPPKSQFNQGHDTREFSLHCLLQFSNRTSLTEHFGFDGRRRVSAILTLAFLRTHWSIRGICALYGDTSFANTPFPRMRPFVSRIHLPQLVPM